MDLLSEGNKQLLCSFPADPASVSRSAPGPAGLEVISRGNGWVCVTGCVINPDFQRFSSPLIPGYDRGQMGAWRTLGRTHRHTWDPFRLLISFTRLYYSTDLVLQKEDFYSPVFVSVVDRLCKMNLRLKKWWDSCFRMKEATRRCVQLLHQWGSCDKHSVINMKDEIRTHARLQEGGGGGQCNQVVLLHYRDNLGSPLGSSHTAEPLPLHG